MKFFKWIRIQFNSKQALKREIGEKDIVIRSLQLQVRNQELEREQLYSRLKDAESRLRTLKQLWGIANLSKRY